MTTDDAPTIILCGALAHRPDRGGHAWVFLNWLLGLRRLGYRTLFIDRLNSYMVGPHSGGPSSVDEGVRQLVATLEPFGLAGRDDLAVLGDSGEIVLGPTRAELLERCTHALALFDVMGFCRDHEIIGSVPTTIGVDIDPGFPQMWAAGGLADPFAAHDRFVTVGTAIGTAACTIPTLGRNWVTTLPPVVLEHWPEQPPGPPVATSIGSWRGPYGPLEIHGNRAGLRVHTVRPLLDLPERSGVDVRVAYEIDPADKADAELLTSNGWTLLDPLTVASDPFAYRDFIAGSGAELCLAKELYVTSRSGWFSDRSAVYLASGRPVVASDTGLDDSIPTGEGLLVGTSPEQLAGALRAVIDDPVLHAKAARTLAEEHLDSDLVLGRLLAELELT